ncbi:MAG TPA: aminotransferase class III-fold pyridoxal phosphate-dependent enzyme [Acidimicrobiales bacterium]|nr:aminotransferase class III-fold pyridoxal phosphate-dependent enzyme [Acidimicrobiales bacterium]
MQRDEAVLGSVLPRVHEVVAERGEGTWLIDVDGRRWLDLTSGIGVHATGHCHPKVVDAIRTQAGALVHTSVVTHNTLTIELAEKLRSLVPYIDDAQVFFCNSGAEAVDGALKMARRVTGRPGVVAFHRAFHGRTLGATSLTTAKPIYQEGYAPLLPGVHVVPWGEVPEVDGSDIGCVIVEPVLGEGGYRMPPAGWLGSLREWCDRTGALLVFDEVQSGMGRTGRWFAAETYGVTPDVLLFAKGIASGMPLAGIIASRSLMERWPTGAHGTTFGGNPVSCAAALATIEVIESEGLLERARVLGERAVAALSAFEVRGIGLMIAVELPTKEAAQVVVDRCFDAGMLVLTCGPESNVLRLIPPLTITDEELDLAVHILSAALTEPGRQVA